MSGLYTTAWDDSGHGFLSERRMPYFVNSQVQEKQAPLGFGARFKSAPRLASRDFAKSGVPVLASQGLRGRYVSLVDCHYVPSTLVAKRLGRYQLQLGDLVIAVDRENSFCAEVDEQTVGAIPGSGMIVVRNLRNLFVQDYLRWFFRSAEFFRKLRLFSGSFLRHVVFSAKRASMVEIPVLPIDVQRQIVAYFDDEIANLEKVVAAQVRVDRLLEERRLALVKEVVTHGLRDVVSFREVEHPEFERIPSHWELIPLDFLADIVGGGTPRRRNDEYWGGDIPWVSLKDMKTDVIHDTQEHVTGEGVFWHPLRVIEPEAVLVAVRSSRLSQHLPIALTTRQVTISQDIKALCCGENLNPYYLAYYLKALAPTLLTMTKGSLMISLPLSVLKQLEICVPPLSEQNQIVVYLNDELEKIDAYGAVSSNTMKLIEERRDVLMRELFTGRLRMVNQ